MITKHDLEKLMDWAYEYGINNGGIRSYKQRKKEIMNEITK